MVRIQKRVIVPTFSCHQRGCKEDARRMQGGSRCNEVQDLADLILALAFLLKVKLPYSNAYLCQTMLNYAKDSIKRLKLPTSVFLQGDGDDVWSSLLKTRKTRKVKTYTNFFFKYFKPSKIGPCKGRHHN